MVRFWLVNRASEDKTETDFLRTRLALVTRVAAEAGLTRQMYLGEEEVLYWFEGELEAVAAALKTLHMDYALSGLPVEVSSRELAAKWPKAVPIGLLAVSEKAMPGKGVWRLRNVRRRGERTQPEPELESTLKREFISAR